MLISTLEIVKPSRYLFVGLMVIFTFGLGFAAGMFATRAYEVPIEPYRVKHGGYRLLTWKNKSGDVCFAIMPRYKAWKFETNPFSKWNGTCGLSVLKDELSALPSGEWIEWTNVPYGKFPYPERKTAEELEEFAKSKGIELVLNPALDVQIFADGPP